MCCHAVGDTAHPKLVIVQESGAGSSTCRLMLSSFAYPMSRLGSCNHKVGYPKKACYEPTGTAGLQRPPNSFKGKTDTVTVLDKGTKKANAQCWWDTNPVDLDSESAFTPSLGQRTQGSLNPTNARSFKTNN